MYREIYHDGCNGWQLGELVENPLKHLMDKYEHTRGSAQNAIKSGNDHNGGIIQCDEEGFCLLVPGEVKS